MSLNRKTLRKALRIEFEEKHALRSAELDEREKIITESEVAKIRLLTPKDFAAILRTDVHFVMDLILAKKAPMNIRVKDDVRFSIQAIEGWIKSRSLP